eukprot:COSAG01_NODE_38726_length_486_cov_0.550388_1_plen_39_part_10
MALIATRRMQMTCDEDAATLGYLTGDTLGPAPATAAAVR